MFKLSHLAIAAAVTLLATASAAAKPPVDAFGDVPQVRAVEISPDGTKVAYIQRLQDKDFLVVYDFATKASKALASITEIRARGVEFVGNNYVVLIASKDTRTFGYRGRYEFSAAFAFNLTTGKYVQLLKGTEDIHPAQAGLGRVVAIDPSGQYVYMPAFIGSGSDPSYDLMRVNLDGGRGTRAGGMRGISSTQDSIPRER